MKHLTALKVKDEWLVKLTDTRILKTREEVIQLSIQNGLKVFKKGDEDKVYAE